MNWLLWFRLSVINKKPRYGKKNNDNDNICVCDVLYTLGEFQRNLKEMVKDLT
jgi:hypothetical protein